MSSKACSCESCLGIPELALQESHFQAQWPGAFTVYQLLAVYLKNHLRSETQIWIYFSTPKLLLSQYSMKWSELRVPQAGCGSVLQLLRGNKKAALKRKESCLHSVRKRSTSLPHAELCMKSVYILFWTINL